MYNLINKSKRMFIFLLLLIIGIASLLPLYWVFTTALQLPDYQNETMKEPTSYVESIPPKLYPIGITEYYSQWRKKVAAEKIGDYADAKYHDEKMTEVIDKTFSGFTTLFQKTQILRWLFNSFYIGVLITFGIVLLDTMAGYVLAKKRFPGRMLIFWIIVATMMIPEQVTLVPIFIMVQKLKLFNSHLALIIPSFAMAFGVFQMRQFLYSVPDEIIEAAKIDGASEWKTFWLIIIPLARPAMAVLGIFTFIQAWNSFLWPIIVLSDVNLLTLPAGLKTLQDANMEDFKLIMSGASVAAIPMIIIFMIFQKNMIKGLTMGGVKE
jgi:multiple sugar transport system permease protein